MIMSGTPATTDGCQMYCPVVSFTLRSALTVASFIAHVPFLRYGLFRL